MRISTQLGERRNQAYHLASHNTNGTVFGDVLLHDGAPESSDERFMRELKRFQSITSTPYHLIDNANSVVDFELALQILYAMREQKPIVLTNLPRFGGDVDLTIRDIIRPRTHKFYLIEAHEMRHEDFSRAVASLPEKIDYRLSVIETQLIKYYGKTFFRDILTQPAKLAAA